MGKRAELLAGLDIGTACVTVVVAELNDGAAEVIGLGTAQSEGLRKGVVVNIDATVQAIARAVREAELAAGCEIHSVYAGVGGGHIKGFNSHGVVAVKNPEVAADDVERVLDAARAVALPLDRHVLHVLPQEFVLDGQNGIKEPVGMAGVRLEARVHIVSAAVSFMQNVVKCCQRANLHVTDLVLTPLAGAEAVLGSEEKDLGVAYVDLGAGTSDLLVFHRGALVHTALLPVGGHHVTNDLAEGLRTPFREAEILKRRSGCAHTTGIAPDEQVEVQGIGGRSARMVGRRTMCDIIEARMDETFRLLRDQLWKAGFESGLSCGVVLSGGGSLLPGTAQLAERVFQMPTRGGAPLAISGLTEATSGPDFAAAVGLVLLGARPQEMERPLMDNGMLGRMRSRMVGWLKDFF